MIADRRRIVPPVPLIRANRVEVGVGRQGSHTAVPVKLTAAQRTLLTTQTRAATAPYRQVLRAKIVLLAAAGLANATIARRLGVTVNTVRKWRGRFGAEGLQGLADRPRSGRPRIYPAAVVAYAKAVACELPATNGVPLSRWSLAELRAELRAELLASGVVDDVSVTTLWRWLEADAIKPWQHRSWIFPATRTSPPRRPGPGVVCAPGCGPRPGA
jgi:transposase